MKDVRACGPAVTATAIVIAASLILGPAPDARAASRWAPPGTLAADSIHVDSTAVPVPSGAAPAPSTPAPARIELAPAQPVPAPSLGVKTKKVRAPRVKKERPAPHVHRPEDGPWDAHALWVSVRVGYNKATYRTAGDGNVGLGFGVNRMLNTGWGLAGTVERNVVGKFEDATESEVPFTIELDRHLKWGDAFRPYFGFGGGTWYHKFSKTTGDRSNVSGGGFFAIGGNAVVSPHGLIGLDVRLATVTKLGEDPPPDPVFGPQDKTTTRFSIKLTGSVTY
ncbi:MAG TPA: hypothetical protein VL123_05295 [Candidatus Udaeobacter sp.]|nr:hypothetical protein [Candidatus Udaeobacter sp.]